MHCSKETIIRTIVLVITLLNQILLVIGKNPLPFSEEEIFEVVSMLATAGAGIWAWWKNNSFSAEAAEADRYLAALRAIKKSEEEI